MASLQIFNDVAAQISLVLVWFLIFSEHLQSAQRKIFRSGKIAIFYEIINFVINIRFILNLTCCTYKSLDFFHCFWSWNSLMGLGFLSNMNGLIGVGFFFLSVVRRVLCSGEILLSVSKVSFSWARKVAEEHGAAWMASLEVSEEQLAPEPINPISVQHRTSSHEATTSKPYSYNYVLPWNKDYSNHHICLTRTHAVYDGHLWIGLGLRPNNWNIWLF